MATIIQHRPNHSAIKVDLPLYKATEAKVRDLNAQGYVVETERMPGFVSLTITNEDVDGCFINILPRIGRDDVTDLVNKAWNAVMPKVLLGDDLFDVLVMYSKGECNARDVMMLWAMSKKIGVGYKIEKIGADWCIPVKTSTGKVKNVYANTWKSVGLSFNSPF